MKKILLVLAMMAVSVFVAGPAIASDEPADQVTTNVSTPDSPAVETNTETPPPVEDTETEPQAPEADAPPPTVDKSAPSPQQLAADDDDDPPPADDDDDPPIEVTPLAPTLIEPTCEARGSVTTPQVEGVTYVVDDNPELGQIGVYAFAADKHYVIPRGVPDFWFYQDLFQLTGPQCGDDGPPTEVTAEAPIADPATCEEDGSLVLPETPHVTYTVAPELDGPGDYTVTASVTDEDFVLVGQTVFEVTVGGKLPTADCVEHNGDNDPADGNDKAKDDDLLPDTGGLPLWILLIAGPMTAAGIIILMRRQPVDQVSIGGRMPSHSMTLPPVKKQGVRRGHAPTKQIGFMKAVGSVVAAVGSFLRGGRR